MRLRLGQERPQRPVRRSVRKVLRDAPGDWINARSSGPGDILGLFVMGAVLILGHGAGAAIAVNWCVSKIPTGWCAARGLWGTGFGHPEWMMFNRTNMYQRKGFMKGPPLTLEADPNAAGVPPLVAKMIRQAESGSILARLTDDWLNSRARFPGVGIELLLIGVGTFIAPIPTIILFPINWVIQQVPNALAIWLSVLNGDGSRFWRSGARQRSDTLAKYYKRHPEMAPEPAVDTPQPLIEAPALVGRSPAADIEARFGGAQSRRGPATPVAPARSAPEQGLG